MINALIFCLDSICIKIKIRIYCTYLHNLQRDSILFKMRREEEKEEDRRGGNVITTRERERESGESMGYKKK